MMNESRKYPQLQETDFDLESVTTYYVGRLEASAHRSIRVFKDKTLSKYDITGMQWLVIGSVLDSGTLGMRITDLSNQLGTTLGFMTNTVNLLVSKKMLARIDNIHDNRSKIVTVTKKFKPLCRVIEKELRQELRKSIYSRLSPEELKTYIKDLQALTEIDTK